MKMSMPVVLLTIALAGCTMPGQTMDESELYTESSSEVSHLPSLQTAPELRIRDLPVPSGYEYNPAHSMIIEYGTVQAGILRYEGSANPGELIGFYRREMPKFDWELSSMVERDEVRMYFQKAGMICEITISPASGLKRKSIIHVYYAPKVG